VLKVAVTNAVVYIASIWLKQKLSIVLNSVGHSDSNLTQSLVRPAASCEVTSTGRDVDWFLNNVAKGLILPSPDAVKFGMLRVSTGRCARLLKATGRIALQDCLKNVYVRPPKDMTFELSTEGHLKVEGKACGTLHYSLWWFDIVIAGEFLEKNIGEGGQFPLNRAAEWSIACEGCLSRGCPAD